MTKVDLLIALRRYGYDTTKKRFLKQELIALCKSFDLPTRIDNNNMADD